MAPAPPRKRRPGRASQRVVAPCLCNAAGCWAAAQAPEVNWSELSTGTGNEAGIAQSPRLPVSMGLVHGPYRSLPQGHWDDLSPSLQTPTILSYGQHLHRREKLHPPRLEPSLGLSVQNQALPRRRGSNLMEPGASH